MFLGGGRNTEPEYEIIVVGGGPAGSAAAIQLAACDPAIAARSLLLDRARFPRPKLCGGGVVRQADRLLALLGVELDVPAVAIHAIRFEHPNGGELQSRPDAFRVVRREEFDHALLQHAKARGVAVREGERILTARREPGGVCLRTESEEYRARVVIGADGAGSAIRRQLVGGRPQRFVALEASAPSQPANEAEAHTAVFDFRPAAEGLRGYYWDFPFLRQGVRFSNRGLGGAGWRGERPLRALLDQRLRALGSDGDAAVAGATIPLYDPRLPQSAPHVLLAGDAVGVDPWLGEGISSALGTGILAAHAAVAGLRRGDLEFADYGRRLRDSAVGWQLRRNRATARVFYRSLAPDRRADPAPEEVRR